MERNFKDVVENIRGAEKDVDKVLNAARLERHEGPNRHMTGEQKLILLLSLIGDLSVCQVVDPLQTVRFSLRRPIGEVRF